MMVVNMLMEMVEMVGYFSLRRLTEIDLRAARDVSSNCFTTAASVVLVSVVAAELGTQKKRRMTGSL